MNRKTIKTDNNNSKLKKAYFAGGCFWGVEHLMQQLKGVSQVISGYMGGNIENPSYEQVCQKNTGHIEVVEITYDPKLVSFETLAKLFFEIHDPSQDDAQGPDIGPQYASVIFYTSVEEKHISEYLIQQLKSLGHSTVTKLIPQCTFWPAEDWHQDYYEKNGNTPYCHHYQKKFPDNEH